MKSLLGKPGLVPITPLTHQTGGLAASLPRVQSEHFRQVQIAPQGRSQELSLRDCRSPVSHTDSAVLSRSKSCLSLPLKPGNLEFKRAGELTRSFHSFNLRPRLKQPVSIDSNIQAQSLLSEPVSRTFMFEDTIGQQEILQSLSIQFSTPNEKTLTLRCHFDELASAGTIEFIKSSVIADPQILRLLELIDADLDLFFSEKDCLLNQKWAGKLGVESLDTKATATLTAHPDAPNGRITFYNWSRQLEKCDAAAFKKILHHELGHFIAKALFKTAKPPKDSQYMFAVEADGGPDTHVSLYGRERLEEDFAESIRCFLQKDLDQLNEFMRMNTHRFEAVESIIL